VPVKGQTRWPSWLALAVGLLIALLSVVGCVVTLRVTNEHEHELLKNDVAGAAALVKVTVDDFTVPMGSVATAATLAAHDPKDFAYLSFPVKIPAGASLALLRQDGDSYVVTAAVGPALRPNQDITGGVAETIASSAQSSAAANRAGLRVVPTAVTRTRNAATFGFAVGPPNTPPGTAVYEQLTVPVRFIGKDNPFLNSINLALYGGMTLDPSHLAFANTNALPLHGDVVRQDIAVGTDQWMAVGSAKEPLSGSLARDAGWMILFLGLLIALLVGITLDVVSRRRRYAEVQVATRTAELARSMSDLRDAQTALVQRERLAAIGQMASVVGHELRNPLTAVTNALYLIRASGDLTPAEAPHLELAERELGRATTLAQDLTDFVRPRTPVPEPFGLDQLLEEVMEAAPPPPGTLVRAHIGHLIVVADRVQVSELLTNLVTNAYQAIGAGHVWIWAQPLDGKVKVAVQDDGPGIDPDVAAHIFEPFVTTKTRGTGLGLAIVRRIAEEHGGSVGVEEFDGSGARIVATLPGVAEQNGAVHPRFDEATAAWGTEDEQTPTGAAAPS
jgi:signal transduction histidine kinase